ncbi:MAG: dipeptidase [Desulfovibrionaceae bacterium]
MSKSFFLIPAVLSALLVSMLAAALPAPARACTTMIVTPGASADGSMLVAHSDDDELGDQRLIFVPARDHAPGDMRKVFQEHYRYPRLTDASRAKAYAVEGAAMAALLGEIPQPAHTYAYFDGNYGIMNERQLMIGECTDGAKFEPETGPGRMFYTSELSRLALERCATAREAVQFMGGIIEKYGYYSTGETLLVADPHEAWVMEMCALPDAELPAAWAAQRVPDGHVFVAANEFRIRDLIPGNADQMSAPGLREALARLGWWKEAGPVDWLRAVSHGEYNHPYYSLRRVWRVMDRVAPSRKFSPWVEDGFTRAYPFSLKPDAKLSVADVTALYRDHYEGTEFDMSQGLAAGPFASPNRYLGPYDGNQNDVSDKKDMFGAWERPISVFYQGYTYVCQGRSWLPDSIGGVLWFAPDVSYTSVFMPMYAGANGISEALSIGDPQGPQRDGAWWPFNFVANWARLRFNLMYHDDILPLQQALEAVAFADQPKVEDEALRLWKKKPGIETAHLTAYGMATANRVLAAWRSLADRLVVKYADGYVNLPDKLEEPGYPRWWLDRVGYGKGPVTYARPQ